MMIDQSITDAKFFTAGRAIFTVDNGKAGSEHKRFTFKITRKKFEDGREALFAKFLTGSDNESSSSYSYLGKVDPFKLVCRPTRASKMKEDAAPFRAINWAMRLVAEGGTPPGNALIIHEGRCARCGRRLTVPASIILGFGPECAGRIGE